MSDFENISSLESLDKLSQDAIEKMGEVQPVEMTEQTDDAVKPEISGVMHGTNVSFKGGNCICSCDTTCTRA